MRFLLPLLFLFAACSTVPKSLPLPFEVLERTDTGTKPKLEAMPTMVKAYMKRNEFFDPNSAEVEDCSEPVKGYRYNYNDVNPYTYGWALQCNINVRNRMGGYTGFETYYFLTLNDSIIASSQSSSFVARTAEELKSQPFTTGKFMLWGKGN